MSVFPYIFHRVANGLFYQNHSFQAFLVSKTYIIFIHVKLARGGGGGGKTPGRNQKRCLKKKKNAKCSEMEKYEKIFCDIFASVSVKILGHFLIFLSIFPLEP